MAPPSSWLEALDQARSSLNNLAHAGECHIVSLTQGFRSLAAQTDAVLQQASSIVSRVEHEGVATILAEVQSLCASIQPVLTHRIEAATSIEATLRQEEGLLAQLMTVAHQQQAIAFHLKALSVLTSVEAAQLGGAGGAFHFLSRELSSFSRFVAEQTRELSSHTSDCEHTVKKIRFELGLNLPLLQNELARIEAEVRRTVEVIHGSLVQLAEVPVNFESCVERASQQINGVVAAIQAHDITRQQIEHVMQAIALISTRLAGTDQPDGLPSVYGGIAIQTSQLKNISAVIGAWIAQVEQCAGAIERLSASEVAALGSMVLRQEGELSAQLTRIEQLQQKSQDYGTRIQNALEGISTLLKLVHEHLERSQNIRRRLELLTYNSYVEADRLGNKGVVVSEIANLVKDVSSEWNRITDQSHSALTQIMALTKQTSETMEAFSEASCLGVREDQAKIGTALESVRATAAFVGGEATTMESLTGRLRCQVADIRQIGGQLDFSFGALTSVTDELERIARDLEKRDPTIARRYDAAEVEQLFSALYSTEIERDVMHAALTGAPPPVPQTSFTGNAVELF